MKTNLGPCPICGQKCDVWHRRHFFLVGCLNEECYHEGPPAFSIPEAIEYWQTYIVNFIMEM